MGIPASVQAQADRAQQIADDIAKANATALADQDTAAAALSAEETAAKAEQDAKAADEASQAAKDKGNSSESDDHTWEQKYRTLQAKYDKEVPRLHREIRDLRQANDDLGKEVETLKAKPAQGSENQDTDKPSKLDPGLLDDYGPEFRPLIEQLAALTDENEKLRARVDQTAQQVEKTAEKTQKQTREAAWERFTVNLAAAVDGFAELNVDPEFLSWLEEDDDLTGEPRKAALDRAVSAMDVTKTAKVFQAFLKQSGRATGKKDADQPPAKSQSEQVMRQVQPSKRTADGGAPPQKKVYSPTEVAKFYEDKRRGKYSAEEADRIEKEIFAPHQKT